MADPPQPPISLEHVRARIDAVDDALLRLLDERAGLAAAVAGAKRSEFESSGSQGPLPFGLRPAREAQVLRRLLARPHAGASAGLVVRLWRELMTESLASQGPLFLTAFGGRDPARIAELARLRFGAAAPLAMVDSPEAAFAASHRPGGLALLPLDHGSAPWGRLLAEPALRVFAVLPCLAAWGPPAALAVAAVEVEPSCSDQTLWVTDAAESGAAVVERLSGLGLAAELLREGAGLKLFTLAGYVQAEDPRLREAPGRLSGVIGAAPTPFDL